MILVDVGKEIFHGVWSWEVRSHGLCGKSRQPLLDACREIKRMGGDTGALAGAFHEGRETADLTCSVEVGAGLMVSDTDRGVKFVKYKPYPVHIRGLEAAE